MTDYEGAPDIVYGRLLESAHLSGYGFERACSELEWLLDEDRWRQVGPGYQDINTFVRSVDLSPFRLDGERRKDLVRKLAELEASQRATAKMLGVGQATVHRDSNGRDSNESLTADSQWPDQPEGTDGDSFESPEVEPAGRRLDPLYSSGQDDWATPPALYQLLHREFRFTLDVCASAENAKCKRYFDRRADGLAQPWTGRCWMNPPYGEGIGKWMAKADETAQAGRLVVCLVPARTDTAWWWDHARYGEVRFLRGRLRFGDGATAPFPSAVVVMGRPASVAWWEEWPCS
jgi:phage N-6-adenine-methyltransferase